MYDLIYGLTGISRGYWDPSPLMRESSRRSEIFRGSIITRATWADVRIEARWSYARCPTSRSSSELIGEIGKRLPASKIYSTQNGSWRHYGSSLTNLTGWSELCTNEKLSSCIRHHWWKSYLALRFWTGSWILLICSTRSPLDWDLSTAYKGQLMIIRSWRRHAHSGWWCWRSIGGDGHWSSRVLNLSRTKLCQTQSEASIIGRDRRS